MGEKERSATSEKQQTSGVVRTVSILETLSHKESINLESLARETALPKATLLRFLSTLVSLGYVYRDPYDRYSLTLKMFSVGSRGLEHIDLINVAQPVAQQLCESLGETVHMGVLDDMQAVYVIKKESSFTIRMHSRVGKSIPLYCTAIGKVLLSGMNDERFKRFLQEVPLKPFTPNTIGNGKELAAEIAAVRKLGWATDDEEHEEGVLCIGAPVRDYSGGIVAAMSVSWPVFRFNPAEKRTVVESITKSCRNLSLLLGWQDPVPANAGNAKE